MSLLDLKSDAVVVGSGAGGGAFSWALSKKGIKVLVLEEGLEVEKIKENEDIVEGALRVVKKYNPIRVELALGKPTFPILYGKCLGGSQALNAGTCFRPPKSVVKKWREMGLDVFTDEYVDKLSKELEDFLPITPVEREYAGKTAEIFERALRSLNYSGGFTKRNAKNCRGCGICVICPHDAKRPSQVSFLPEVVKKGGEVYTGARVERVIIERGVAKGVEGTFVRGERRGEKFKVSAQLVCISAGALWTPLILLKSGIKNPHIGKHLHLHPVVIAGAVFDEEVKCWKGVLQNYYCDQFLEKDGIIILTGAVPPPIGGMLIPGAGNFHQEMMRNYKSFADAGALISDSSEGTIRYLPRGVPFIKYKLNKNDTLKMKKALKEVCRIFFYGGAKKVFPTYIGGMVLESEKDISKIDEIFEKRKFILGGSLHPLGTARMSSEPQEGVVDKFCRVFGVKNLFVADGSILPTSTSVNPQQTIMLLSLHGGMNAS